MKQRDTGFPEFYLPFTTPGNPNTPALEEYMVNWAVDHNLLREGSRAAKYFRAGRFGSLMGDAHPKGTLEDLLLAAEYTTVLLFMDDRLDADTSIGRDPERLRQYLDRVYATVFGTAVDSDSDMSEEEDGCSAPRDPITAAFVDVWRRFRQECAATGQHGLPARFREAIARYFEGQCAEAAIRVREHAPTPEEYILVRRGTVAGEPMYLISLLGSRPRDWRRVANLPAIRQLYDHASDQLSMLNDVFSAHKERLAGERCNMVLIEEALGGCSPDEAIRRTVRRADACMREFERVRDKLYRQLRWQPSLLRDVRAHVRSLEGWMTANFTWSMRTMRYKKEQAKGPSAPRPSE